MRIVRMIEAVRLAPDVQESVSMASSLLQRDVLRLDF